METQLTMEEIYTFINFKQLGKLLHYTGNSFYQLSSKETSYAIKWNINSLILI